MEHTRVLAIKLIMVALLLFLAFNFFGGASLLNTFVTAIITTGLTYLIGDLWILPDFGNKVATLIDFVVAGLSIWAVQLILTGFGVPLSAVLLASASIAVGEWFFHLYVLKYVF
ncbi:MAG: DUF2512 family protein [Peptococcaceae bacterium]|nr:DUF2512 family protein [Peptococcaceae bacterium]